MRHGKKHPFLCDFIIFFLTLRTFFSYFAHIFFSYIFFILRILFFLGCVVLTSSSCNLGTDNFGSRQVLTSFQLFNYFILILFFFLLLLINFYTSFFFDL